VEQNAEIEQDDPDAGQDAELDALRIRQVSQARRSALRAAAYCRVGALVCAACAVDLLGRSAYWFFAHGAVLLPLALYGLPTALLAVLVRWLLLKAGRLSHEAGSGLPLTSSAPPDFSTLGDGSQRAGSIESALHAASNTADRDD
jgi:hypothetical protein